MKIRVVLSLSCLAFLLAINSTALAQTSSTAPPSKPITETSFPANFGKLPLSFEVNQGQSDSTVKFLSHGNGYSLFLTDSAAVLVLSKAASSSNSRTIRKNLPDNSRSVVEDVIRMELPGARPNLQVSGSDQLPGRTNYFIGKDPSKWRSGISTYAKVRYEDIYPGVDLVYYGNQRQLEYDFVVSPRASPRPVRFHFAGAQHLSLTPDGDLTIKGKNGEIAFHKPVVYQLKDGLREPVPGRFQLLTRNNVRFTIGSYDHSRELVIDPALAYSTYLGGSVWDYGNAIAVDATGDAYVVGVTMSPDFPVTDGAFQTVGNSFTPGFYDKGNAFVTKFNPKGSALIYSTFLGGTFPSGPAGAGDAAWGVAVDSGGNAYVTGQAGSRDFPVTAGAFQTVNNNAVTNDSGIMSTNAFVTKLNPTGSTLVYSTYLGGTGNQYMTGIGYFGDAAAGIAVDFDGNAYVAGNTVSFDFPVTANAFQKTNNAAVASGMYGSGTGYSGFNFFITKLNPTGSGLVYSTYLGGFGGYPYSSPGVYDHVGGIAIDSAGNAYVAGNTYSSNFPTTPGAYQRASKGLSNVILTKLNPAGSALVYSTYLGGGGGYMALNGGFYGDSAAGIAVDSAGSTYITGVTYQPNFPVTPGSFQTVNHAHNLGAGGSNAFVTKFNPTGSALVYSTYLGGSCCDSGNSIALDAFGSAYITGTSGSTNFPTTSNAFQRVNHAPSTSGVGAGNVIFSKLDPPGSSLLYSSYLGGSGSNSGNGIDVDQFGNAYITGLAGSSYFPLAGTPFQTFDASYAASAFVSKFIINTVTGTTLTSDGNPQKAGVAVTFTAHVTPNIGTTIPTGSVTFSINGTPQPTLPVDDTGHASFSTSSLSAGRYDIAAAYSGSPTISGSSASLGQTIIGVPARITVASGTYQTAVEGSPFALPLVVQVQDERGVLVPGAVINFSGSGLTFSGNPAVTSSDGRASVIATAITTGSLTVTATTAGVATPATFKLTATLMPGN